MPRRELLVPLVMIWVCCGGNLNLQAPCLEEAGEEEGWSADSTFVAGDVKNVKAVSKMKILYAQKLL